MPPPTRSGGWRGSRTGRLTAPVGRASISLLEVFVFATGVAGLASRPLSTRDLRNSSSSATPGVRIDAPVDVDVGGVDPILAGRVVPVAVFKEVAGRARKPLVNGS